MIKQSPRAPMIKKPNYIYSYNIVTQIKYDHNLKKKHSSIKSEQKSSSGKYSFKLECIIDTCELQIWNIQDEGQRYIIQKYFLVLWQPLHLR